MDTPIMMDVDPLSAYEANYDWSGHIRTPVGLPSSHMYPHTTISADMGHPVSGPPVQYTYQAQQPPSYPQSQYQPVPETTHSNYNLTQPLTHQPQATSQLQPPTNQPQPPTNQPQPPTNQPHPATNELSTITLQPTNGLQPINHSQVTNEPQPTTDQPQPENQEEQDIKPDIAELEASLNLNNGKKRVKRVKPKGRVSSYWNKKITDKDFEFYGCSFCNVSFKDIVSLDKHMVMHSNRLTTYEFRKINVEKRKMIKKEQRKKKKEAKIKKEAEKQETERKEDTEKKKEVEVEIKPEDGYIGMEKATDIGKESGKTPKGKIVKQKKKPKTLEDYDKNSPAYLRAMNEQKYVHAYKCFGCDKLFALSYYLRLHVRSHTGEKPYVCKICGYGFITASKMNRHVKRIHMATRHQCRICYRVFTRFELLVKHFDSKHPEDKLDGEVYDYNAILPYLKELEEQMREEKEKGQEKKQPKTEDPWGLPPLEEATGQVALDVEFTTKKEGCETKKEDMDHKPEYIEFVAENKDEKDFETPSDIVMEEMKLDREIKQERDDDDGPGFQDDDSDDVFKEGDRDSDEEYIPTETWVRPHSPLVKTKRKQRTNKRNADVNGSDIDVNNSDVNTSDVSDEDSKNSRKWEQPTRCPLCDKFISKFKNLASHINTHTDKKPFVCTECDKKYCTAAALSKHMKSSHPHFKQETEVKPKEVKRKSTKERKKDKENKQELPEGDTPKEEMDQKIKDDPTSEEEYFPSETWARPPSPLPAPPRAGKSTCTVCNKELSTKTYLHIHMRTHTGEKPFACYICGRAFITASKMHRHVLTHDETWEGKDIKPESGEENKDLEKMLDKARAKISAKKSKREFFKNKRKHGPWTHTCEFCNKKFLHNVTLQVHMKSHKENERMKCYYCLEEFDSSELLVAHKDTHGLPNMYQCQFCKKEFPKKGPMMTHRKKCKSQATSGDGPTLTCEICSKRFHCASRLRRHMAAHTSAQYTLRYECPVCAHMFHTRYHIQMHLRSHIKEGLIQEENRGAVLAMVLQNARRIPKNNQPTAPPPETAAADERSRICNICGEIFQHFYFLEQHLKLHANKIDLADLDDDGEEKKHVCTVCSKSFKLPYYLKLHSFTHTKEKPFICQECGKGFITRGKLKRHLETHQGLKKYQCHICYKFFTRTSYLRIHIRTIHGPQEYGLGVPIGVCQGLPMPS